MQKNVTVLNQDESAIIDEAAIIKGIQEGDKMKRYQYLLFDLDGTLTDSALGITNSVKYALEEFGIVVKDRGELLKFIGPPLVDSFMEYYGFSREKAAEAVAIYREYFQAKGIFENRVYDGVEEVLKELKDRGKTLILATSKPEVFTVRILEHFHLAEYFYFVAGATMDESRNKKDQVIAYALEQCKIADKSEALMIGDREHDILGAGANGIDSVGVLYGFGSREELEAAGADYIVETLEELLMGT